MPKRPMMSSTAERGGAEEEGAEAEGVEKDPDPKMSARRSFVDWADAAGAPPLDEGDSDGISSPIRSRSED